MVSQTDCNHYYLKPDDHEVRLSQLLKLETKVGGEERREKLIGEHKWRIIDEDQRRNDEQAIELHELIEKQSGASYERVGASTGTQGFHFA